MPGPGTVARVPRRRNSKPPNRERRLALETSSDRLSARRSCLREPQKADREQTNHGFGVPETGGNMLKGIARNPAVLRFVGRMMARYLMLVRKTSSLAIEPADLYERVLPEAPLIVAMWHGQHFMMPFARPEGMDARVMISRSADGEVNAVAAEMFGIGLIRASGSQKSRQMRKRGGMRGFFESLAALEEGASVVLTADVPKGPARVAGRGIVQLAKHSGCPILPVAFATSRHIDLDTWDRASINLPFSRAAVVGGDLIRVPKDADDDALEAARVLVEEGLDAVTARAYEMTEKGHG